MEADASELLDTYVVTHNLGVQSGDFSEMLSLFADDAEMRFLGIEFGPFLGCDAVAAAFRDHPPTDRLQLISVLGHGDKASAVYGWGSRPEVRAGTLVLTSHRGMIARLTVSVQA